MGKVESGIGWDIKYVISCIKFSRKNSRIISKKYIPSSWEEKKKIKSRGGKERGLL